MQFSMNTNMIAKSILTLMTVAHLSGCIIHVGGDAEDGSGRVSSVFGGLTVSEGKRVSDVNSVNGSIDLEDHVSAQDVETVNGSIEIGDNVSVDEAETVNGDIDIGRNFSSAGFVETVNGDIRILRNSQVGGNVKTVNGDIELSGVSVNGDADTRNGDITLADNTHIKGDVVFHHNKGSNRWKSLPSLTISADSKVDGKIILHREVQLNFDDAELLKKVQYEYNDE